ncbi:hypothetical protein ACW7GP_01290 [Bacillus cereus]
MKLYWLAINVKNITAQLLYKKCGFIDEDVRKIGKKGKKGALIIMSYYLKESVCERFDNRIKKCSLVFSK